MMKYVLPILYACLLVVLLGCAENGPLVISVSPDADERATVGGGAPVSLSAAKSYIRQLHAAGDLPKGGVTVELSGGVYSIAETLVFSASDGGSEDSPVVYRAKTGEQPIISGGKKIQGWQRKEGHVWAVTIPEVAAGKLYFRQLFADDKRLIRARTPNEGWFRILGQTADYDTLKKWDLGNIQLWKPNDPKMMCGAKFDLAQLPVGADKGQAEILMLSSWSAAWTTIQRIDSLTGDVLFNTPLDWPANIFSRPNPYRIENVRSALDQPGEWYLNAASGELLLQVAEGEDPNEWEIIAPTLEMLVKVEGTPSAPVRGLSFEGLHFKHAKVKMGVYEYTVHEARKTAKVDSLLWDWPADIQQFYPEWPDTFMPGYVDLQGAVYAGGAFEIAQAQGVSVRHCKFSHLGAHGVYVRLGAHHTEISHCEFYNLGGGGIYQGFITDEYLMAGLSKEEVPSHSVISHNLIHDGTHFHVGAVGILLSQTHDNQVVNNEIKDMGYTGVSMGWTWGFQPNLVYNNLIARNHIHHVVRDMADGGAIYTLGTLTGCIIEENYLHHIIRNEAANGAHVKGLYFDQGSQGAIVRRNVLHDISDNYISYHKDTPFTSFVFDQNYLADSALTHNGDYQYYEFDFPGNEVYASPGQPGFPTDIVEKAGIKK